MSHRCRSGVTLLELMTVTAIIAIVLGIGTAFFTGLARTYRLRAAADQVAGVVRSASSHAAWIGAPSRVDFDRATGFVRSVGPKPVGQWHFEAGSGEGAFGRDALLGAASVAPGRVGDGVEFGPRGYVDCGPAGIYTLYEGVAVEAWVQPVSRQDMVVVQVGNGAALGLSGDLEVLGWAGGVSVRTEKDSVPLHRWTHLALLHDGRTLSLRIDHVERARVEAKGRWTGDPTAHVTVSDERRAFAGTVDEVRIDSVVTLEEFELGPKLAFERVPAGGSLAFDARGRLDEFSHPADELVVIHSETRDERRSVRVTRSGSARAEDFVEGNP